MSSAGPPPPLPPWSRLEGQVVLVTGASSGIGRDFCLDLARAGCRVVAAARRADRLRSLCDEINASAASRAPRAVAVEVDVAAGGSALEAAVQKAWDAFGRIDALVNNAGIRGAVHSPLDWPEDEWDRIIKTNLTGSWLVAKHVCRRMRDAKLKGSVVNITSIAGLNRGHLPGSTGYASSKAAVHYATKIMALELGADRIRVNSIAPGLFKSEITAPLFQKRWLSTVASKIVPLKEHGATDPALTSLVRFLIHEASSYVTGNIFIVDSDLLRCRPGGDAQVLNPSCLSLLQLFEADVYSVLDGSTNKTHKSVTGKRLPRNFLEMKTKETMMLLVPQTLMLSNVLLDTSTTSCEGSLLGTVPVRLGYS
ncbi:uncharacterized protein [Zea mays]|uniref:uncharacterized protein isoform X1 n=1 Tax=Zea mays TaxID=4577 RepID=UPI0004DEC50E|nr:uncharacterized protein LOC100286139 isoform X1 [Zea mays]XP_035814764.1 uncharacterized protein LOC100286139 isoform X1 [Zea mays]XP_035814766.1 uncharacterized protein LOC100286139 isoform X1 [Zea mays]XP_035814768.1 uncharacterized protein LOC100286139 isoform X1 [Zea mays]XP_035814769.1 uncharacterized protein LOC100286139 isoform X1 [Zea mays]|eukprot:XP_008680935.1 uncharacterized protein LOC100286139 isoform X1 [Zea mays]